MISTKTPLYFAIISVSLLLFSCQPKESIVGSWQVTAVSVGEDEMTPDARWMRFYDNQTQESGNGLFQHSYGKWEMKGNQLKVRNTNGLKDTYDPFTVQLEGKTMHWEREEDGQKVKVILERSEKIPLSFGDKVLGLWKVEEVVGNGPYFQEGEGPSSTLFLRWDKRYVLRNESGRCTGIYHVHAHRPELTLIPSNSRKERSRWKIEYLENGISLQQINSDSLIQRSFLRIDEFPE